MRKFSCCLLAQLIAGVVLTMVVSQPALANGWWPGPKGPGPGPVAPPTVAPPVAPPVKPPAPPAPFTPGIPGGVRGPVNAPPPPPVDDDLQTQTDRMHFKLKIYTSLNNEIKELKRELQDEINFYNAANKEAHYYNDRIIILNTMMKALENDKKYLIKGHADQAQHAAIKSDMDTCEKLARRNVVRAKQSGAKIDALKAKISSKEAERDRLMKRYWPGAATPWPLLNNSTV